MVRNHYQALVSRGNVIENVRQPYATGCVDQVELLAGDDTSSGVNDIVMGGATKHEAIDDDVLVLEHGNHVVQPLEKGRVQQYLAPILILAENVEPLHETSHGHCGGSREWLMVEGNNVQCPTAWCNHQRSPLRSSFRDIFWQPFHPFRLLRKVPALAGCSLGGDARQTG